jgi:FtsZ-interacting cell division protein YlmF
MMHMMMLKNMMSKNQEDDYGYDYGYDYDDEDSTDVPSQPSMVSTLIQRMMQARAQASQPMELSRPNVFVEATGEASVEQPAEQTSIIFSPRLMEVEKSQRLSDKAQGPNEQVSYRNAP